MLNRYRLSVPTKSAAATWAAPNSRFGLGAIHGEIFVTHRGTYVCFLGCRQRHPVILPFRAFAHDPHPPPIPVHRHVRNRASTAAGLASRRPGIRDPEFKCSGGRAPSRPDCLSVILLVTSTGIFIPLEVALNRIWRFPNNRSYLGNQLIALGLAFSCGVLALLSVALTAGNIGFLEASLRGHGPFVVRLGGFLMMKMFAIFASIAIFFLIYWLLPNGKVPARVVLPAAVIMGLLSETLKYAYVLALPRLNFQEVYGPFALSASLMFWAFLTGLLLLTGP